MAEILLYNTTNWMDKLDSKRWAELSKDPNWAEQYAKRWQKDMVVEIRPDGFWSKKGLYPRKDVFRVLLLPGVKESEVRYLLEEGENARKKVKVSSGSTKEIATVNNIKALEVKDSLTNVIIKNG
jgi:hypothetical protein